MLQNITAQRRNILVFVVNIKYYQHETVKTGSHANGRKNKILLRLKFSSLSGGRKLNFYGDPVLNGAKMWKLYELKNKNISAFQFRMIFIKNFFKYLRWSFLITNFISRNFCFILKLSLVYWDKLTNMLIFYRAI